jgi:hypothetical protein
MFIKTITISEAKECDYAFFRPRSFFWVLIWLWSRIRDKKFNWVAFSHVGILLEDDLGKLRLYDAKEWELTGYRHWFHKAYIFRYKSLSASEKYHLKRYLLSRKNSEYDDRGIVSFPIPWIPEDEFKDYCSELQKNWAVTIGKMQDIQKIEPYEFYKAIREKVDFIWLII